MVVAYALPVEAVEDSVPSIFREAKLSSESELWRILWLRRLSLFILMTLKNLLSYPKRRRSLDANEFM